MSDTTKLIVVSEVDYLKINNLAGKYRAGFGTPFDLAELKDSANLDINQIRFVRIVDVVGSINTNYARRDSKGRKINDPWPTRFASSGFDLDAVGVIHQNPTTNVVNAKSTKIFVQNPVENQMLRVNSTAHFEAQIFDFQGREMARFDVNKGENLLPVFLENGMYIFACKGSTQLLLVQ